MRHFRRAPNDAGAAAVEFALLFPIFMILAMGLINGGLAFSRQINVTQAAREASRYGATYDIKVAGSDPSCLSTAISCWLTDVDTAVQQSAGNKANPIGGYDYRCVAIVVINSAGTAVDTSKSAYMETNGSASSTTGSNACPTTTPALIPAAQYVQVVLSRNVNFFVVFINPTLHLDAVSTTPYEGTKL